MALNLNDVLTFCLLVGLELVLGIDNILLISIVTGRLPESQRAKARRVGLGLGFILRFLFVMGASALTQLTTPVAFGLSWRSIILIAGGAFLLYKATYEIHHTVSAREDHSKPNSSSASTSFFSAIIQLLALDAVFSIDSVITAVGLTDRVFIIIAAVLVSFLIVLYFAGAVSSFITKYPAIKILALSFLVTIGVTLFLEGMGYAVPKGYIYLPMGFSLVVELLQMRYAANREKSSSQGK